MPRSQIRMEEDDEIGHVIDVRDWLMEKRSMLEFTPYTAQQIEAMNA